MEFIIRKSTLQRALKDIAKVLKSSQAAMKIIVEESQITFIAGNEDMLIEVNLCAQAEEGLMIKERGTAILSAKHFADIVKKLPSKIHIQLHERSVLSIVAEEISTQIYTLIDVHTLNIPDMPPGELLEVNAASLLALVKQTVFAAADNGNRPVLTGVQMTARNGEFTCVSTDAHRYSISSVTIPSHIEAEMIVPHESLIEWTKLTIGKEEKVTLFLSKSYLALKSSQCDFYIRLIDGRYPSTSDFIPQQKITSFHVHTETFLQGIERAALFADAKKNHHLKLQIQEGRLRISSNAKQIGMIEESQIIEGLTGDGEIEVFLDSHFLLDYLRVVEEKMIRCSYHGAMKPVLFEAVGHKSFLHLISPVRSY